MRRSPTEAGATSQVVASAPGHSSPVVTHAHYIDGATARRARTRRVIGKVAPDPALRVVGDEPATRASRKSTRRGSGVAAKPALRVVNDAASAASVEPAAGPRMGNG
jgi:hypothetical protein